MLLKATQFSNASSDVVSLRCPGCRQIGTLEPFVNNGDLQISPQTGGGYCFVGQRRCPNPSCRAHVFVAYTHERGVMVSYPAERIDFDSSNLPRPVKHALEEAVTCHANRCYVASAMLIRKTLEALCDDQGAEGGALVERIKALRAKIVLPQALLDGLDEIRLLGNDAAHIEARTFDGIGQEEVEVGLDFTKEFLKAVYQLQGLVSRFQALKKTP